jgi:hypothetical protein
LLRITRTILNGVHMRFSRQDQNNAFLEQRRKVPVIARGTCGLLDI